MPKVTVVIPCYNHGRYLDEAVDSVLNQTYADYEIFVVNDGSTDPFTVDLLRDYQRPKTTVFHKQNGHLSAARNYGIARATSEYILTLDADNRFAPQFLEKAAPILASKPAAGVVTCFHESFGKFRQVSRRKVGGGVRNFLAGNPCLANSLFRKQCWVDAGGYDENMKKGYEDWNFWIAVTKQGWMVESIPEVLFYYRVAEESMVTGSDRIRPELIRQIVQNHREVFCQHLEEVLFEKERLIEELRQERDQVCGSLAYRLGRCLTDPAGVIKGLRRRSRHNP